MATHRTGRARRTDLPAAPAWDDAPARPPLAGRLANSRPPEQSRRLLGTLLLATGLAAHVPVAAAAGIGLGVLTAVLCCLWLETVPAALALAALPALCVPLPLSGSGLALTGLGSLLLVVAGLTITQLTEQMLQAQSSALRHMGAREALTLLTRAEKAQLTTELQRAATCDPLTGLLNRVATLRHVDQLLAAGAPVGLLVLRLNQFGKVNDAFGAQVGDELLAAVAERLRGSVRDGDPVGRLGGNEFGIVLTGSIEAGPAQQVGDRFLKLLTAEYTVGPHLISVSACSGLALHLGGSQGCAAQLLQQASGAATAGRSSSGTTVYDPTRQASADDELRLEADMRAGLTRGEFFLLYQPKVCTRTGRMVSVEALVRWQHPARGLISPDAFIGLAERSGLITTLGLQVMAMACAQLRAWTPLSPGLSMAVNVSARQLADPDLVPAVREVLYRSGIDPNSLILELTESLMAEDEDAAMQVLWRLRTMGVRLSLDDFGTGYSSLGRLGELPLDEMKIDKTFVDRLGALANDSTALVTAAVAMGHGLGLSVVAEGVENEMQAALLTSLHCDLLQGYLLGRPMPAEALMAQFACSGITL